MGLPYFGIDWPTTNGTLTATATGPATDVALGQILTSGNPLYWDPVTQSGWTSYQVGNQWHETFFEDPTSLYDASQLARFCNFAGVGIWALGMDNNDADNLAALDGFPPAANTAPTGPTLAFLCHSGGRDLVLLDHDDVVPTGVDDHDDGVSGHDHHDDDLRPDDHDDHPGTIRGVRVHRPLEPDADHPREGDRCWCPCHPGFICGGTADELRQRRSLRVLPLSVSVAGRVAGEREFERVPGRCHLPG